VSVAPAPQPTEAVCVTCRFGQGDERVCVLIESAEQDTLFAEGPCRLGEQIPEEAKRLVRRRYPFARSLEDDIASDALLRVLETGKLLAPETIRDLPGLRPRMRESVRNAVIDALRHHKLVTRIRCGACVHFSSDSPPPGCHLEFLPNLGAEAAPNPWHGEAVKRTTDPRGLEPKCDAFSWRRPETHDIFEEEVPGMDPEGTQRERALGLLVQAIDRVARQDDKGLRTASALFWHYLRGRTVRDLADEAGVSEKTIKRLLADGRERLLTVLQDDFEIASLGDLL